jgi:hypothetical protein
MESILGKFLVAIIAILFTWLVSKVFDYATKEVATSAWYKDFTKRPFWQNRKFLWFRGEVEDHEGGMPLATMALVVALTGFTMYMTMRTVFETLSEPLKVLTLDFLLCFFFALLAIGIKHLVRTQGTKAIILLALLAFSGALVPFALYTTGNMAIANGTEHGMTNHPEMTVETNGEEHHATYDTTLFAYPPESGLTPTATDVIYSRMALVFAGAHPEIIKFVGYIGVLDDAYGLIGITGIEFYHASKSGDVEGFLAHLGEGAIYMVLSILLTIALNKMQASTIMYFASMALFWLGMHEAHLHTQLAFVPVIFMMPWKKAHKLERPLNYSMFFVIAAFAYVTAAVDPGQWGELTNLVLFSAYFGKFIGIGLLAIALRPYFHALKVYRTSELVVAGLMAAIVFKVGGLVAILVYPQGLLTEALLATNSSVLLGLGLAIVLQVLKHVFKWNWTRELVPFEDTEFGTGLSHNTLDDNTNSAP